MTHPASSAAPLARPPGHVAIVMDGNGRWAQKRWLPRVAGHKQGVDALRQVVKACIERRVPVLSVFAFSSENWNRPQEEVSGLMSLLANALAKEVAQLSRDGVPMVLHDEDLDRLTAEAGPVAARAAAELQAIRLKDSTDTIPTLKEVLALVAGRVPLLIELLSPAHRPVQVTRDLPGFWRGSYADVKAEMKGRYPRHPWPDNPLDAPATRRAKPRGT